MPTPTPAPTPTGVQWPTGPTNIYYDIAADVPAEQVKIITTDLQMAHEYLDSELGGGIPAEARKQMTVKIVATGRGNQGLGGGGACCTAFSSAGGVSTMRPFFDVAHVNWAPRDRRSKTWTVIYNYTRLWQHELGCYSGNRRPLGRWLHEGITVYVINEAMIKSGEIGTDRSEVVEGSLRTVRVTGQLDRPLRDFEGTVGDITWPGNVGFLALHRIVPSAPGGILSFRTICEEVGRGSSLPEAFETAFGVSLDDFYDDFEKYHDELLTPTPTGVKLPTGPTNIYYDIAPNVPAEQVEIITTGLQMAQNYLDSELDGGIPEEVRKEITVKIVATGQGNQEPWGGGACCTAFSSAGGVSTMRLFFDIAHPHWHVSRPSTSRKSAVHEYTHIWQHHLGCISKFYQPLGNWLNEGIAEYIAYEAMIKNGEMRREDVTAFMLAAARSTGQLDRPLRDFAGGAVRDIGIWPGHVGFLALHRIVPSAPGGILSLRTLCEEVAASASDPRAGGVGMYYPEAFETAFGISLDDFYDDFEKYREELNSR